MTGHGGRGPARSVAAGARSHVARGEGGVWARGVRGFRSGRRRSRTLNPCRPVKRVFVCITLVCIWFSQFRKWMGGKA